MSAAVLSVPEVDQRSPAGVLKRPGLLSKNELSSEHKDGCAIC